ncbi:serine/threonine protein kinase, partial [Streptosporangium roseum]|uniref:serine/threonine protein kinase n=1 Tax=Streptosporangium roseum TaxID=2001 RepID=UPI003330395A
ILGPDGPRVCDIGLGITGGEPDYRAPENLHAELNPGAAPTAGRPADLFSWAATLAYAATGQPPFGGELPRVMEGPANLTGLPPELATLLASCLDKNPHARPDTKAAMLRLLGEQSAVLITGDDTWQDQALPAVPQQPAPAQAQAQAPPPAGWGAPPLPQDSAPPAQATFVLRGAAQPGERPKRGGFSLVLAVCVGVVALLSGLGLWAAGSYTSLGEAERAAANAAAAPHASLGLVDQGQQGPGQPQGDGQGIGVGDGTGEEPPDKVTVPWGATTDPQNPDVAPMQLNTGSPTVPAPSMTSFVTPPAIPTNAPVPPTAVPTAAPTAPPTATPSPSATATVTVTPTPSPTPTPPRVDPTPAPTATPSPSEPATPTPSEPPAPTPTPAPSEPATETPTAKPTPPRETPKPTPPTVAPKPTPKPSATQTATAKPTPPATTPKPTATAKPTPKPSSTPPVVEPTQPPAPTVKPTPPPATTKPTQSPTKSAPPASRPNPYTPQQACGSGYYVQRSASFPGGTTYQL